MPQLWEFSIHLFTWLLMNRGQCFPGISPGAELWIHRFTLSASLEDVTTFKNVCTNIQSILFVWVPVILYPCQNVMFLDLLSFANLVDVKWHLTGFHWNFPNYKRGLKSFYTVIGHSSNVCLYTAFQSYIVLYLFLPDCGRSLGLLLYNNSLSIILFIDGPVSSVSIHIFMILPKFSRFFSFLFLFERVTLIPQRLKFSGKLQRNIS